MKKNKINNKTRKKTIKHKKNMNVFEEKDYMSGDGFMTSVWGPLAWTFLHTISFNYPNTPTKKEKIQYRDFILSLQNVLPCKYCRDNLKDNLKKLPLTLEIMKNRETFSRYVYELHELVNTMLGKVSGLSYEDIRERYEHFRARCSIEKKNKTKKINMRDVHIEKGCTEPLYGKKAKSIIKIVPKDKKCNTFEIDINCMKHK